MSTCKCMCLTWLTMRNFTNNKSRYCNVNKPQPRFFPAKTELEPTSKMFIPVQTGPSGQDEILHSLCK